MKFLIWIPAIIVYVLAGYLVSYGYWIQLRASGADEDQRKRMAFWSFIAWPIFMLLLLPSLGDALNAWFERMSR